MKYISLLLLSLLTLTGTIAQETQNPSPIIFIYDASGSMWQKLNGEFKKTIASDVLTSTVSTLPENQPMGLVAYGHRSKEDCKDVEFLVDVDTNNKNKLNASIKNINPLGKTPLAYSALQVINKLRIEKLKATIILITDGVESCGGNICDVIKAAKKEGIEFKLHIVGFGLKGADLDQLKCAAEAGEGQYYDASDAGALSEVLQEAVSITIDESTPNVTVYAVKNNKPVDAMLEAFLPGKTQSYKGARSYGDTAKLYLPPGNYSLRVTALEQSKVSAISIPEVVIKEGELYHKDLSFDGGKIAVFSTNNGEGWDAIVKVYKAGESQTAASGRTYGRTKEIELDPGIYDIQLEMLRAKGDEIKYKIQNVEVTANKTVETSHDFKTGILMIGAKSASELVDATVTIVNTKTKKTTASGRTYTRPTNNPKEFILSPGTYSVKLRTLVVHKGKEKSFTIKVEPAKTQTKIVEF